MSGTHFHSIAETMEVQWICLMAEIHAVLCTQMPRFPNVTDLIPPPRRTAENQHPAYFYSLCVWSVHALAV